MNAGLVAVGQPLEHRSCRGGVAARGHDQLAIALGQRPRAGLCRQRAGGKCGWDRQNLESGEQRRRLPDDLSESVRRRLTKGYG